MFIDISVYFHLFFLINLILLPEVAPFKNRDAILHNCKTIIILNI